jgi:hypothetical protein
LKAIKKHANERNVALYDKKTLTAVGQARIICAAVEAQ